MGEAVLVSGPDPRSVGAKFVDPGKGEVHGELGVHVVFLSIAGNLIDTLNCDRTPHIGRTERPVHPNALLRADEPLPVRPGLQFVELRVQTALADQAGVVAGRDHLTRVEHDDQVGHPHR